MRVRNLQSLLADASLDAVALVLPAYADLTAAAELQSVDLVDKPWICETQRRADGTAHDVFHPDDEDGFSLGWNAATDEYRRQHVVLLSAEDPACAQRGVRKATAGHSTTSVAIYEGEHATPPKSRLLLYEAKATVEATKPLLERASDVLGAKGYHLPLGPYSTPRTFSMFIHRETPGYSESQLEACVHIAVAGGHIRVRVQYRGDSIQAPKTAPFTWDTVAAIARRTIARLRKGQRE
ncbi:hypothetical protein HDG41_002587 [Paraburkholderia sp. JPY162]|uniref:Uncharacterized protein n=1 Tax=Paraburkholderia youngii TaxID=2782701 RepID=A0A7W8L5E6_9BURK|nr:hypothetical protein [Paraburkholderia youngii]